jgi:hypothetical protein
MSILGSLFVVLVAVAARLAMERSRYFRAHAKDLPPMPLGL